MRKFGVLFLAAVVVLGLGGCSKDDPDPVGTWEIFMQRDCAGDFASGGTLGLFADGTGSAGDFIVTWTKDGDVVTINFSVEFDSWTMVFVGTVEDASMSGTFTSTVSGCWNAVRLGAAP